MEFTNRIKRKVQDNPISSFLSRISNKMIFLIAVLGGLIAAAFATLIPISTLEAFTGASGLSEIIPATGAPLGSSARTLFVVFTAILAASILLVLLLSARKSPDEDSIYSDDDYVNEMARERNRMALAVDDSELAERIYQEDENNFHSFQRNNEDNNDLDTDEEPAVKKNFVAVAGGATAAATAGLVAVSSSVKSKIKKLPFMGGDDSIKSFDDLPKLRGADKHPDAPARRPLSANEDLGERILDKEWDQKQSKGDVSLDSNLSDIVDFPEQENKIDPYETEQTQDDGFLQTDDVKEDIKKVRVNEDALNDGRDMVAIAAEESVEDNIAFDHNNNEDEPIARETVISGSNELPTIDSLMGRLEVLVEKRAQRLQDRAKSTAISSEETTESNLVSNVKPEIAVKKETRLDDYADVIDDAAIKRAEKSTHDKRQAVLDDESENIERPAATLVSTVASNEGDTVVTKSQKSEMDNALKSALDTLHKMTERSA